MKNFVLCEEKTRFDSQKKAHKIGNEITRKPILAGIRCDTHMLVCLLHSTGRTTRWPYQKLTVASAKIGSLVP